MTPRLSKEEFIRRSIERHGNEYDYSGVIYTKADGNVTITCKKVGHGSFSQTPNSHWGGSGCPICARIKTTTARRKSLDTFIKHARAKHGDTYEYSSVDYQNTHSHVTIICKKIGHGQFSQTPHAHLEGRGCHKCGREKSDEQRKKTTQEFIDEARKLHNGIYDYSRVVYNGVFVPVEITCVEHGIFLQTPQVHLRPAGCQSCRFKTAGAIKVLLGKLYEEVESEVRFDWLRNYTENSDRCLPCDIVVNGKVCIEVDGAQHFRQREGWSTLEEGMRKDKLKTTSWIEHGFHVVRVEQEFYAADSETQGKRLVELVNACLMDEVPKLHIIASSDSMYDYLR